MIVAGHKLRVLFSDGREVECTPTLGDEVRFERLHKTMLPRLVEEDGIPAWLFVGIVHVHLRRTGVEGIPEDADEFADLLDPDDGLSVVVEGKTEDSDQEAATG